MFVFVFIPIPFIVGVPQLALFSVSDCGLQVLCILHYIQLSFWLWTPAVWVQLLNSSWCQSQYCLGCSGRGVSWHSNGPHLDQRWMRQADLQQMQCQGVWCTRDTATSQWHLHNQQSALNHTPKWFWGSDCVTGRVQGPLVCWLACNWPYWSRQAFWCSTGIVRLSGSALHDLGWFWSPESW